MSRPLRFLATVLLVRPRRQDERSEGRERLQGRLRTLAANLPNYCGPEVAVRNTVRLVNAEAQHPSVRASCAMATTR